jgi:hypothetical protein
MSDVTVSGIVARNPSDGAVVFAVRGLPNVVRRADGSIDHRLPHALEVLEHWQSLPPAEALLAVADVRARLAA